MSVQSWIMGLVGLLTITLPGIGMSQTTSSTCVVKVFDREDYKGRITVKWSNDLATPFELTGSDKWLTSGTITLPAALNEFSIDGTLAWKHYREGSQKSSGVSKHRFTDFTPAVGSLRSQQSWGKRMDQFVKELAKLENQHPDRDSSPSEWIESSKPVSQNEINAVEQRLKFALPEEHKQLLRDYGVWTYSDSFCVAIEDINRADTQMRTIWGSPASEFASLSEKNKALYQASTMLYVEAGDGYGALIYHPSPTGAEYYWIHQDELDDPDKLVDSQGKLRDYSSTMLWLIANQILMYYQDAFPKHTFIDRSSAAPLPYELRIDFPTRTQLEARLDVDWAKFE